ncbi:struthiocalcin-2-like [Nerophis lumbriciformis]|uniref:struthiocalcin-2-like n=1 Tax=Nerophis lumbriciformis TaxID=546530 RepID=UPI002ADF8694|nr:struthiocalcin-2-like [Nerophis lumbriciformis]
MAFALRVFFLLCGISGLLSGVCSTSLPIKNGGCCPKGWIQLDGFCYSLRHDLKPFDEAEAICRSFGGNLVSIHSFLENLVVYGLIEEENVEFAWIGLHDPVGNGVFQWTDGASFGYDNFPKGQPSDHGACVVIYRAGDWFVKDCSFTMPFVCILDTNCCGGR